jgi:hypothetical protein
MIKSIAGQYLDVGTPHFDAVLVIDGKDQKAQNYGYGWWMPDVPNGPGEVLGQQVPAALVTILDQITELMRGVE